MNHSSVFHVYPEMCLHTDSRVLAITRATEYHMHLSILRANRQENMIFRMLSGFSCFHAE